MISVTGKFNQILKKVYFILKLRKPFLVLKMLMLTIRTLLYKQRPPFRQIEIQSTLACNLRCTHCSAKNFEINDEMLSFEDYKKISKQAKYHDSPMLSFTGGEPLLDPRLEDIIRLFDTRSMLVSITTNGTLLTFERARRLKLIGVDGFMISLDGSNSQANDMIRGDGVFESVINAIQIAKGLGFFVMIIHTLTHLSIKNNNFNGILNLAQKLDIPLHVSLVSPVGNLANMDLLDDYILSNEDILYLEDCQKKYPFLRRDLDGNYFQRGCPAGVERFVISPYGDVMPCTKIQASFGNIKDEPMIDIRNRMINTKIFDNYPLLCLAAEDDNFLNVYMPRTFNRKDLPIDYNDYFKGSL